jgi:hypothetical protein
LSDSNVRSENPRRPGGPAGTGCGRAGASLGATCEGARRVTLLQVRRAPRSREAGRIDRPASRIVGAAPAGTELRHATSGSR